MVLGCSTDGERRENPRWESGAPITNVPNCAHAKAPAHMVQGSMVTYRVHSFKYLPPKYELAMVTASISACAVTSFSFSVSLCALAIILSLHTTMAPMGISPSSAACLASANAFCIYCS